MLDFFKPKDKIDAKPSVSKPTTSSVSNTTVSETSDIELIVQDDSEDTSLNGVILNEKQTSDDDNDLVHIKDEQILETHIFKFLCFFKPTSDGKLKCQLTHVRKKRLSLKKPDIYCFVPIYKNLKQHFEYMHKELTMKSIRNLTEYKIGSTTISLMSMVMINRFFICIKCLN